MRIVTRYGVGKDRRRYGIEIFADYEGRREEVYKWCCEHFGDRNKGYNNPRWTSSFFKDSYWFKNKKDFEWFVLRWT